METLKLTNEEVMDALEALRWFALRSPYPHPLGLHISQTYAAVDRAAKEIGEEQEALARLHADREGEGEDARPKKKTVKVAGRGEVEAYVIERQEAEYKAAYTELMAQERTLRVWRFAASEFDFLLPKPEGQETNKEIERRKFIELVPPFVWAGLGPFLTDNDVQDEAA